MGTPPSDRVRVYKFEDSSTGGQASQHRPYPTAIDRNEDAIDCRGVFLQDASSNDETVAIWREGDTIHFRDASHGQGVSLTLADLVSRVLEKDSDHGNRGGGSLHSVAVANGAAGFMSGTDKARIDSLWSAHGGKSYALSSHSHAHEDLIRSGTVPHSFIDSHLRNSGQSGMPQAESSLWMSSDWQHALLRPQLSVPVGGDDPKPDNFEQFLGRLGGDVRGSVVADVVEDAEALNIEDVKVDSLVRLTFDPNLPKGGDALVQMAFAGESGVFHRVGWYGGSWGNWRRLAFADEIQSGNFAPLDHNHDDRYSLLGHSHTISQLPVAPNGQTSSVQLVRADDVRLSNARTPTAHSHTATQVTSGGTTVEARLNDLGLSISGLDTRITGLEGFKFPGLQYSLSPLTASEVGVKVLDGRYAHYSTLGIAGEGSGTLGVYPFVITVGGYLDASTVRQQQLVFGNNALFYRGSVSNQGSWNSWQKLAVDADIPRTSYVVFHHNGLEFPGPSGTAFTGGLHETTVLADLSDMTGFRLSTVFLQGPPQGYTVWLDYWVGTASSTPPTAQSGWVTFTSLNTSTTVGGGSRSSGWQAIPTGARQENVWLRLNIQGRGASGTVLSRLSVKLEAIR